MVAFAAQGRQDATIEEGFLAALGMAGRFIGFQTSTTRGGLASAPFGRMAFPGKANQVGHGPSRLFGAEGEHGIGAGGAAGGDEDGGEGDG